MISYFGMVSEKAVMDAVTNLLHGGLQLDMILHEISHDNHLHSLGFTLKPNSSQSLPRLRDSELEGGVMLSFALLMMQEYWYTRQEYLLNKEEVSLFPNNFWIGSLLLMHIGTSPTPTQASP